MNLPDLRYNLSCTAAVPNGMRSHQVQQTEGQALLGPVNSFWE